MNESTFAELAAGHALSALSPADEKVFEATLAEHPEWEKHMRAEADTVALLSEPIAPVAPPAAIRAALLARIAGTPQTGDAAHRGPRAEDEAAPTGPPVATPTGPSEPRPRGRLTRRWFTLAASVAVLLAVGFGTALIAQQLTRPAAVVALDQIHNASDAQSRSVELGDGGAATAHWSASLGEVVFVSDGLPALAGDETFELWFVRGDTPVSAGTFAAEEGAATALLTGAYQPGDVIAVTVEQAGGSPTGAPTGEPILAIATA